MDLLAEPQVDARHPSPVHLSNGRQVGPVDQQAFYRNTFSTILGTKAVDFVHALEDEGRLVEGKDHPIHPRT